MNQFGVERGVAPFPIPTSMRPFEEVAVVAENLPVVWSIVAAFAPRDYVVDYQNADI